jgi:BirA family biotin operon repressor/biotin-[acetyl-CoA-carboxylase] ligase
MITGKTYDPLDIIKDVRDEFQNIYRSVSIEDIRLRYLTNLYRYDGLPYRFEDAYGVFSATIHSIEPTGHLRLRTSDGELRRYEFKELKFII